MHQLNRCLLISYCIVLVSCSLEKRIAGTYVATWSSRADSEKILLRDNQTFKVVSWSDVGGEFTANGTWVLNNDTLILNRESVKSEKVVEDYRYSYNPDLKGVLIKTLWKDDSTSMPFIEVFLNDSLVPLDSIEKGSFASQVDSIQSVRIRYTVYDYKVPKPNSKANELVIYWDFKGGENSVDIGSKWKFKNNTLHSLEKEGYTFKKTKEVL